MSFIIKNVPLFALSVEKFLNVKKKKTFAIILPNCHYLHIFKKNSSECKIERARINFW
jgi:predicted nucleic-acid-binding Zn-ribbon protein